MHISGVWSVSLSTFPLDDFYVQTVRPSITFRVLAVITSWTLDYCTMYVVYAEEMDHHATIISDHRPKHTLPFQKPDLFGKVSARVNVLLPVV